MCFYCIRCRPDCTKRQMKPPKKCPNCGAFNNAVRLTCRECGAAFEMQDEIESKKELKQDHKD